MSLADTMRQRRPHNKTTVSYNITRLIWQHLGLYSLHNLRRNYVDIRQPILPKAAVPKPKFIIQQISFCPHATRRPIVKKTLFFILAIVFAAISLPVYSAAESASSVTSDPQTTGKTATVEFILTQAGDSTEVTLSLLNTESNTIYEVRFDTAVSLSASAILPVGAYKVQGISGNGETYALRILGRKSFEITESTTSLEVKSTATKSASAVAGNFLSNNFIFLTMIIAAMIGLGVEEHKRRTAYGKR